MKKDKQHDYDDGRTIANMDIEGFKWYRGGKKRDNNIPHLTFKERLAMYFGALLALLPQMLMILASFSLVTVLIYLWLR